MNKIRVIIKEPGSPPRIDHIDSNLESLQAVLHGGYLEALPCWGPIESAGIHAYGDEEAKLKGLERNFTLSSVDYAAGNVLFANDDGEGAEASLTESQVATVMEAFGHDWQNQN